MSTFIPNTETQYMFNESILKNCTITFDSWYAERKSSSVGTELQVDVGSAQQINSRKYLIRLFQTQIRIGLPNKDKNNAIFDTNPVTKYSVEIDGAC